MRAAEGLLEHLGAGKEEALAFGDAAIDLPILAACGFAVAMGNASHEVKAAADYVTGDVAKDRMAKAFAALGLA